jgi:hypothetical protein
MTAVEIWNLLVSKYPAECARLRNSIFPLPDTDKALYEKIDRLAINTSIADGRSGYEGNPYEQTTKDLQVIALSLGCIYRRNRAC